MPYQDQHEMIDLSLIKRLVIYADLKSDDVVLEIGGGSGNLTKEIAKSAKVIVVEINPSYKKDLEKITPNVIIGDILDCIDTFQFNKIIANIPYSISEQLFKKIIILRPSLCVLTTGQHFYKILTDTKKKLHYLVNAIYDITLKENVEPYSFDPRPRTKSVVILMKLKENKNEEEKILSELVKQHDKKLKNAIIDILTKKNYTKRQAKQKLLKYNEEFLNKGLMSISNNNFLQLMRILKEIFEF